MSYEDNDDMADYYEPYPAYPAIKRFAPRLVVSEYVHPISQPDRIVKYVNQTKIWTDHTGTEHKIKDMNKEYLFNILAWAARNQDRLNFTYNFLSEVEADIANAPVFVKIRERYLKLVA